MARKAKVKVKRGKVKIKLKSSEGLLLDGQDGVLRLLAGALAPVSLTPPPRDAHVEPLGAIDESRQLPSTSS